MKFCFPLAVCDLGTSLTLDKSNILGESFALTAGDVLNIAFVLDVCNVLGASFSAWDILPVPCWNSFLRGAIQLF